MGPHPSAGCGSRSPAVGQVVIHNAKDFPRERVPIEIQPLADFAHNCVTINPSDAVRGVEAVAARSGRRGMVLTTEDVRDTIERRYDSVNVVAVPRSAATRDDQCLIRSVAAALASNRGVVAGSLQR